MLKSLVTVAASLLLVACSRGSSGADVAIAAASADRGPLAPLDAGSGALQGAGPAAPAGPFDARLLTIAKGYSAYHRLGDPKWALADCVNTKSTYARWSQSQAADTHGKKIYYLFVSDFQDYDAWGRDTPAPVGQTLVKESWVSEEVPKEVPEEEREVGLVRDNEGRSYRAARKAGLFIMTKLDPATPGTDSGWVYGIVTADRSTVTSAGKVPSCVACHEKAPRDRVFGARSAHSP
jgi:hypothetical protein